MTNNKKVLQFVADVEAFAQPDKVVWIDGSDAQRDALREEACATGEIIKLNQEKLPGCYYHRTAENDVARVEDRTFICCEKEEDALPHSIVKWKAPKEAYAMVNEIAKGAGCRGMIAGQVMDLANEGRKAPLEAMRKGLEEV